MSEETNDNSNTITLPQQTGNPEESSSPSGGSKETEIRDETNSTEITELKECLPIDEPPELSSKEGQKANDINFNFATEHILNSPSDLADVVSSFENLQPIYGGSEAVNFRSEDTADPPLKVTDEKDKKEDIKKKKSDADEKLKIASEEKKADEEFAKKRDRRKSSVLTDADVSRKSSEDPYPIGIPLKKQVNKSTRKKLWREIQKRKPFITENVFAHIHHFAKPPFRTWGCNNCNYRKDVRSYSYEYWNM